LPGDPDDWKPAFERTSPSDPSLTEKPKEKP